VTGGQPIHWVVRQAFKWHFANSEALAAYHDTHTRARIVTFALHCIHCWQVRVPAGFATWHAHRLVLPCSHSLFVLSACLLSHAFTCPACRAVGWPAPSCTG
jgi:hypothetical protein